MAGDFAFILFALGIVGTGLLAIPVLAGSAAYAIGEACKWPIGLSRQPSKAAGFYATLTAAAVLGMAITLSPINPIKALYWTAVINEFVAVPVMTVMMLMTAHRGSWASSRSPAGCGRSVGRRPWRWPHASSEWSSAGSVSVGRQGVRRFRTERMPPAIEGCSPEQPDDRNVEVPDRITE